MQTPEILNSCPCIPHIPTQINFAEKQRQSGSEAPQIASQGVISVDIDVPPPFNMLPKQAIEAVGNTALSACLQLIMVSAPGA